MLVIIFNWQDVKDVKVYNNNELVYSYEVDEVYVYSNKLDESIIVLLIDVLRVEIIKEGSKRIALVG